MKKILFILFSFFFFVSQTQASANITGSVVSTTKNTIVISIKNNGLIGLDASGGYLSVVSTKVKALNTKTNNTDSLFTGPRIVGGESKSITIGNLFADTPYTISVEAEEGTIATNTVVLSATTKKDTVQTGAPKNLPLLLDRNTVISTPTSLTNFTITNTGTKDFNATITLKESLSGRAVETQQRLIGAGIAYNIIPFLGLTPDTQYDLVLSGTEVGSSSVFTTKTFKGFVTKQETVATLDGNNSTPRDPAQPAQSGQAAQAPSTPSKNISKDPICLLKPSSGANQCNDGIDNQCNDGKDYGYGVNNGDHKADHYGIDTIGANGVGDGVIDIEPDPSCFSTSATEEKGDDVVSSIIPCTDKCTFSDVFRLLNNIISFFFKTLLIPIFVGIIIYAGYQYIIAEGNPNKVANLKKMLWHIVLGLVVILCAWLIVRTIMTTLLNEDFKQSGVEFLEN